MTAFELLALGVLFRIRLEVAARGRRFETWDLHVFVLSTGFTAAGLARLAGWW